MIALPSWCPTRALFLVLLLGSTCLALPPGYQTITPRAGEPFLLRDGFTALEPAVAGTGKPLPGWGGAGHMIRLDDGRLFLAYTSNNRIRTTASDDGGATWTEPAFVEGILEQGVRTARPVIIEAADKTLWLSYYGWLRYDPKDPAASENNLWAVHSRDGGKIWSKPECIYKGYVGMLQGGIRTSKGNLVVPLCRLVAPHRFDSLCVVSTDAGQTWQATPAIDVGEPESPLKPSAGISRGALEPSVAELRDGRVLMLIRTVYGHLFQSLSSDGGLTWSAPQRTVLDCGGPCNVVQLPGGRVAVAWNPANMDHPDTQRWGSPIGYDRQSIAISDDGATTWRVVSDFVRQVEGKNRVVHSTICGLPDGTLLLTMPGRSTLIRVGEAIRVGETQVLQSTP